MYNVIKSNEELAKDQGLFTIIDLKHDLSTDWYKGTSIANANGDYIMDLGKLPQFIPYYLSVNNNTLKATDIIIATTLNETGNKFILKETPFTEGAQIGDLFTYTLTGQTFSLSGWQLSLPETAKDAKHMFMIVRMTC
jgi:hypothetical protein